MSGILYKKLMVKIFVIMPFRGFFDGYYDLVIKPSLISLGFQCGRSDEIYGTGAIINDIYDAICDADICIADVTDRNPNVAYELGMAHAIGKPTILITQRIEDVPFDYSHLRLIKYEPQQFGWEKRFIDKIDKTLKEILANPNAQRVLKSKFLLTDRDERESVKRHIENIFLNQSYDVDRVNEVYLDNNSCLIKTSWKGISRSTVFHLCHNLVCDLPGPIEVRKAYDRLNAREMDCFIAVSEPQHFTYYPIFKQFKNLNQPFEAETEVFAPGYLDVNSLLETGEAMMSTQAIANGLRYIKKEDWIFFPKKDEFSRIEGEYISNPNPDLIGKRIRLEEGKKHFVLKLKYQGIEPFQQETAAKILLSIDRS